MEEANRQYQMEIQSRGLLDTIDTIIPLKKIKRTGRGVDRLAAQSNAVVAVNTESTSRTELRSDSNNARKSHERRVIQSER
jgi:hypothetical protein